jgi:hypothetical protein
MTDLVATKLACSCPAPSLCIIAKPHPQLPTPDTAQEAANLVQSSIGTVMIDEQGPMNDIGDVNDDGRAALEIRAVVHEWRALDRKPGCLAFLLLCSPHRELEHEETVTGLETYDLPHQTIPLRRSAWATA